jgi:hypothetical protein
MEGAAVALSCSSSSYVKPTVTYDQLASIQPGVTGSLEVYSAGAWLVGYLLDVFGPKAFMSLYATLPHDAGTADIDTAFRRIFGPSLADVWGAALAESQPRNACVWECSRPAIPLDGTATDSSGPCGPSIANTFSVASETTVTFTASAASLSLGPCGAVTPPGTINFPGKNGLAVFYRLPAEKYFVSHTPVAGTLVGQEGLPSMLSASCTVATDGSPLALPDANLYVAVPQAATPWFLALPSAGKGLLVEGGIEPAATASLCSSCASASCQDATQFLARHGATDVLQLTTDPTRPFSEYGLVLQ